MDHWVNFYNQVLGFRQLQHFSDDDISTEYSALMSKVVQNGTGRIKFPINERPRATQVADRRISAILWWAGRATYRVADRRHHRHGAPPAHKRHVEFLRTPDTYYEMLSERVGKIDENMDALRELGILVDRDDEGYLLQIFTRPVQDRPTVFFEIIQRARAASAPVILRPCSKQSSANRSKGATCRQ